MLTKTFLSISFLTLTFLPLTAAPTKAEIDTFNISKEAIEAVRTDLRFSYTKKLPDSSIRQSLNTACKGLILQGNIKDALLTWVTLINNNTSTSALERTKAFDYYYTVTNVAATQICPDYNRRP